MRLAHENAVGGTTANLREVKKWCHTVCGAMGMFFWYVDHIFLFVDHLFAI